MSEVMDKLVDAVHESLLTAICKTDPKELTEDEKFALCFMAGCAMETSPDANNRFKMRTVEKAAFIRQGNQWLVYQLHGVPSE